MGWKWFETFGHDSDSDGIIHPGHDLHGRGKGLGHRNDDGPVILSVPENQTAVSDIDQSYRSGTRDDGVSYSIAGGSDAGLFTIDAETGELSFSTAPDFEAPADADGNNVYDVVIRTTIDGKSGRYVETTFSIEVTNVDEGPVAGPNAGPNIAGDQLVASITNWMGGDVVATLLAQDPNFEDTLSFRLEGDDKDAFLLVNNDTDPSDGIDLDLVIRPEFVDDKEDAGSDGDFNVTVFVTDQLGAEDFTSFTFDLPIQAG